LTVRVVSLTVDANDPVRVAWFWATALRWDFVEGAHDVRVLPTDGTSFGLVFVPVLEPKTAKNPIHLDLVSESVEHQREVVDRLSGLGAQRIDIGQGPDADHVVLADPEGNEFCVVLRGEFLADTGFIGAVVFEPANPTTGYFWGEAIEWPIVYDDGGDVAIRAPDAQGPFLTFGPPGVAKRGKNRLYLDLATGVDDDRAREVDRLVALGARRVDTGQEDASWIVLVDPNDNEFRVRGPH